MNKSSGRKDWSPWYLLFLVECAAVLWPPFYNRIDPRWGGVPFFYWYQLLWVVIAAALTAIVYFATESIRR
jgi:Na+/melibiose symporter-like transporter